MSLTFIQQKLLDNENQEGNSNTLEMAIFNTMKKHNRSDYLSLVNKYAIVYENSIKKYFSIVSSISSLLVTMGLIGTVFGLTITMSGLKKLVSSSGDNTTILTEMATILSGVDISFYTTLFGAFFGGVVLRICLIINNRYAHSIVNNVKLKWMMPENLPDDPVQSIRADSEINNILIIKKQYLELSKQIQGTNEALYGFKSELTEISKIPIHNKLALIADSIDSNTIHLKKMIGLIKDS